MNTKLPLDTMETIISVAEESLLSAIVTIVKPDNSKNAINVITSKLLSNNLFTFVTKEGLETLLDDPVLTEVLINATQRWYLRCGSNMTDIIQTAAKLHVNVIRDNANVALSPAIRRFNGKAEHFEQLYADNLWFLLLIITSLGSFSQQIEEALQERISKK